MRQGQGGDEVRAPGAALTRPRLDMGGMGFIEGNRARCMLSVLSSTQMLIAARDAGAERFFFSSSACVYPVERQSARYGLLWPS